MGIEFSTHRRFAYMKRKVLFLALMSVLGLGLASCGGDNGGDSTTPNPVTPSTPDDSSSNGGSNEEENFEVKTTSDGGNLTKDSYSFTEMEEGDEPSIFNQIEIGMTTKWSNTATSIIERNTKILSKNEDVIASSDIKLDPVLNSEINDSNGSNGIVGFNLIVQRDKVHAGETKIKVHIENDAGSSLDGDIDLCAPVTIVPFGQLDIPTFTENFSIALPSKLESFITEESQIWIQANVNTGSYEYGSPFESITTVKLTTETWNNGADVTINDFKVGGDSTPYRFTISLRNPDETMYNGDLVTEKFSYSIAPESHSAISVIDEKANTYEFKADSTADNPIELTISEISK